jgi:hypothetical protein
MLKGSPSPCRDGLFEGGVASPILKEHARDSNVAAGRGQTQEGLGC